MINLTKPDETATIDLSKGSNDLVVRAQWVDNGDGDDDNDDLDLRCSILHPGDKMYLIDGEYRGSLQELPFAHHHGDVQSASVDIPGEEMITVARDIAKRAGGPVALCFSVYSALGNGAVSVASLRPQMKMSCGSDEVVCSFDFNQGPGANNPNIYTYVIGYAIVTESEVILAPSGKTSKPGQEETPWIFWKDTAIDVDVVGPAVFKGAQAGQSEKYNKKANIPYCFEQRARQATEEGPAGRPVQLVDSRAGGRRPLFDPTRREPGLHSHMEYIAWLSICPKGNASVWKNRTAAAWITSRSA